MHTGFWFLGWARDVHSQSDRGLENKHRAAEIDTLRNIVECRYAVGVKS